MMPQNLRLVPLSAIAITLLAASGSAANQAPAADAPSFADDLQVGELAERANDRRIKIHRTVNGRATEIAAGPDDTILPNDAIKVPRRMF
jgi:hypothetical protein